MISLNAGRKMGSCSAVQSWRMLSAHFGCPWDVAFITEFDGRAATGVAQDPETVVWRHYPGAGSRSMAWILQRPVARMVRWKRWEGQAGALLLEDATKHQLFLVGLHGGHG